MKKYLSVFSLTARESIYRIVFIWLLSGVFQTVLFIIAAKNISSDTIPFINSVFDRAFIPYIFFITIVLTGVLLIKTGTQFSSKTGYTLRRLYISEKTVFFLQSVYNTLILFMLICAFVILYFFLVILCTKIFPEEFVTNQTVYKAFYDNLFLQNLFSGRDILRMIRNILFIISMSVNYSAFSYLFRRGKKWIGAVIITAASFVVFTASPSISTIEFDAAFISVAVLFIFAALISVQTRGEQYDS